MIDGNNVFGSRADGWWNDRSAAADRFAQAVAEWCRTHADQVTLVFDGPITDATVGLENRAKVCLKRFLYFFMRRLLVTCAAAVVAPHES